MCRIFWSRYSSFIHGRWSQLRMVVMVQSSHASSRVLTVVAWMQTSSIPLLGAEGGIDDGSGVAFARAKRRRPAADKPPAMSLRGPRVHPVNSGRRRDAGSYVRGIWDNRNGGCAEGNPTRAIVHSTTPPAAQARVGRRFNAVGAEQRLRRFGSSRRGSSRA
jgi:hypothetical protein